MILRYDQGMNTHPEAPRPMPGRGPKPLTAEEAARWRARQVQASPWHVVGIQAVRNAKKSEEKKHQWQQNGAYADGHEDSRRD